VVDVEGPVLNGKLLIPSFTIVKVFLDLIDSTHKVFNLTNHANFKNTIFDLSFKNLPKKAGETQRKELI
jgi:hypothetical protein